MKRLMSSIYITKMPQPIIWREKNAAIYKHFRKIWHYRISQSKLQENNHSIT